MSLQITRSTSSSTELGFIDEKHRVVVIERLVIMRVETPVCFSVLLFPLFLLATEAPKFYLVTVYPGRDSVCLAPKWAT